MAKTSLFKSFVNSIKELKGPALKKAGKWNNAAYKHVTRHPVKYAAGASAVVGFGFAKTHSSQEKKLKKHFAKLPKSDPRYKAHKKAIKAWADDGYPTIKY